MPHQNINVKRTTWKDPDIMALIQLLDADLHNRYGSLQKQYNPYNTMEAIETFILVQCDNVPVGCGAYKQMDRETVEIKRMFVKPEFRGQGIASRLLAELEAWALDSGFNASVLETGIKQTEAIGLYTKAGYVKIDNYGQYQNQPNSVCFKKILRKQ